MQPILAFGCHRVEYCNSSSLRKYLIARISLELLLQYCIRSAFRSSFSYFQFRGWMLGVMWEERLEKVLSVLRRGMEIRFTFGKIQIWKFNLTGWSGFLKTIWFLFSLFQFDIFWVCRRTGSSFLFGLIYTNLYKIAWFRFWFKKALFRFWF